MNGLPWSWQISGKPCHDHVQLCQGGRHGPWKACHSLDKPAMEIHDLGRDSMKRSMIFVNFLNFSPPKFTFPSFNLVLKTRELQQRVKWKCIKRNAKSRLTNNCWHQNVWRKVSGKALCSYSWFHCFPSDFGSFPVSPPANYLLRPNWHKLSHSFLNKWMTWMSIHFFFMVWLTHFDYMN